MRVNAQKVDAIHFYYFHLSAKNTTETEKRKPKTSVQEKKPFATALSLLSCNKGTAEERIAAVTSHQVVLSFASRKKS